MVPGGAPVNISAWLWARLLAIALIGFVATAAHGQIVTDGDSLRVEGTVYRLWGIDAPELAQTCPDGWAAGAMAAARLGQLTAGKLIECYRKDIDRYGRAVAMCYVDGQDLAARMVLDGLAWAFTRYSNDYKAAETSARQKGLGVHGHDCVPAWDWRASQRRQR